MDFFDKKIEGYAEGEEPLHFYYNREERIKNAPKIVQDYYAGRVNQFTRNPFKAFFANRFNRFMFVFLLLFCLFAFFLQYQVNKNNEKIGNTSASLAAFSYSDEIYVSLKFLELSESKKKVFIPVPLSVKFQAVDSSFTVVASQEVTDLYDGKELFIRTRFNDYDIIKVLADVTFADENKEFSANVVKR